MDNYLNDDTDVKRDSVTFGSKIGFEHAEFWWQPKNQKDNSLSEGFVLRDIDVQFPVGELTVIGGPTGAGKSSLLLGLLGEMPRLKGRVFLPRRSNRHAQFPSAVHHVAYVPQQAWLMNDTIRNNITFGEAYDPVRYAQFVRACALERDF